MKTYARIYKFKQVPLAYSTCVKDNDFHWDERSSTWASILSATKRTKRCTVLYAEAPNRGYFYFTNNDPELPTRMNEPSLFERVLKSEMNKRGHSTMGVSKESISKFLIGNRFHVKLRILSPYSNRILFLFEILFLDSIWIRTDFTANCLLFWGGFIF